MSASPDGKQLSVTLPAGVEGGDKITVKSPDNSYFEVVVPDSAVAGDTLNILINKSVAESDRSVVAAGGSSSSAHVDSSESESSSSAAVTAPKSLTQTTIESALHSIFTRVSKLDEDYKITAYANTIVSTENIKDRALAIANPILRKAREINDEHKIVEKVNASVIDVENRVLAAGRSFLVFARQIDEKYALSSTAKTISGRVISVSAASVEAALQIVKSVEEESKKAYDTTQANISTKVATTTTAVSDAITTGTDTVNKAIADTKNAVTDTYSTVKEHVNASIATTKDVVADAITIGTDKGHTVIANTAAKVSSAISTGTDLGNKVLTNTTSAVNVAKTVSSDILSATTDVIYKTVSATKDLVSQTAIAVGIKSGDHATNLNGCDVLEDEIVDNSATGGGSSDLWQSDAAELESTEK